MLIPVPARQNFSARFDWSHIPVETRPEHEPPLYVFVEGWGCRSTP